MEDLGTFKIFIGVFIPQYEQHQRQGERMRHKLVCIHSSFCTPSSAKLMLELIKAENKNLNIVKAEWTMTTDLLRELQSN